MFSVVIQQSNIYRRKNLILIWLILIWPAASLKVKGVRKQVFSKHKIRFITIFILSPGISKETQSV